MLGAVVLAVEQQHGEELRGSDLRGHQPVAHVVADGWNQPVHVSHHQLPAAEPWALHCVMEKRTFTRGSQSISSNGTKHWDCEMKQPLIYSQDRHEN